jgi:hypothetical protein
VKRQLSLVLFAVCWEASASAQAARPAKLEPLEVREFNPETAEWHKLWLLQPRRFHGLNWHTASRGGSDDDLQILVPITGAPSTEVGKPLVVIARSVNTRKIVASRRFTGVNIGPSGRTYQALLLQDMACGPNLEVVATMGAQTEKITLALECVE